MENSEGNIRGVIFDIDHFSSHDGPGIRSVVYLKGCPLRCVWCHSPESQSFDPEPLRLADRCRHCVVCLSAQCSSGAWSLCGRSVSMRDILNELLSDRVFYDTSGGGVTISGGEALSQPVFAHALLAGLRRAGIHTVLETSGMGSWEDVAAFSEYTDIYYYDIKAVLPDKHRRFTGFGNEKILDNLARLIILRGGDGIVLRVPLIPGYNDSQDDLRALYGLASELEIQVVHLLPYNITAGAKYEWLGRTYTPGSLARQSAEHLTALRALAPDGLMVVIAE